MADNTTAQAGFRTYIGLRYVPIIAGLWDITKDYEQLMIVTYQGNSYTSKKPVPAGIPLTNDEYWVMTGNYNVQVANLQAELEAAVRQILDYATDFEKFKTDMMALYDGFVVDADGKVLAKVEEYEHIIGEQYEAFVRYVNNAINDFRSEMDSFTSETREQINTYLSNTSQELDTKFTNYTNLVNTNISNFEGNIGGAISNLQDDVRNLSTSGQMSDTEVQREVSQARGGYDSLGQRLTAMNNIFLGYKDISVPSGVFDMNNYTTIGIYNTREGTSTTLYNTPFGDDITNEGFTLVVYGDKLSNNFVKQLLTIIHNGTLYEYERFMVDGVFREWKTFVTPESTIICSENVTLVNFNTIPTNTLYTQNGYEPESTPSHAPNIIAGDSYTVLTLGSLANRTQIVYTGTNNRCFIRRRIGSTWTDWDYLTTSDDLDSAMATLSASKVGLIIINNLEVIETLGSLNGVSAAYNLNNKFNVCRISGSILPYEDDEADILVYLFETQISTSPIYRIQTFITATGNIYHRTFENSAWGAITSGTYSTVYKIYGGLMPKTISEFNDIDIDYTKIGVAKLTVNPFTGENDTDENELIYFKTSTYQGNIYQTITTFSGRTGFRYYDSVGKSWRPFVENGAINYYTGTGVVISVANFNNINFDMYRVGYVEFSEDITGDATPNADDRKCYFFTRKIMRSMPTPITNYEQIFITETGRIFVRKYNGETETWSAFSSPYYTKAEIDAMLQNI